MECQLFVVLPLPHGLLHVRWHRDRAIARAGSQVVEVGNLGQLLSKIPGRYLRPLCIFFKKKKPFPDTMNVRIYFSSLFLVKSVLIKQKSITQKWLWQTYTSTVQKSTPMPKPLSNVHQCDMAAPSVSKDVSQLSPSASVTPNLGEEVSTTKLKI